MKTLLVMAMSWTVHPGWRMALSLQADLGLNVSSLANPKKMP
jgi:hypothetical protein